MNRLFVTRVMNVHTRYTESASQRGKILIVLIGLCPSLVDLPQMDVEDGLESETPLLSYN